MSFTGNLGVTHGGIFIATVMIAIINAPRDKPSLSSDCALSCVLFDHLLLSVKRLRIPMHNIKIHSSYYP
jgi:hypothetical protein